MPEIAIGRYGKIVAGENEGYFVHVRFDAESTRGYYIYFVNDINNPSDGGDYWAEDMEGVAKTFRLSEWQIEWL